MQAPATGWGGGGKRSKGELSSDRHSSQMHVERRHWLTIGTRLFQTTQQREEPHTQNKINNTKEDGPGLRGKVAHAGGLLSPTEASQHPNCEKERTQIVGASGSIMIVFPQRF